eukprot:CAMPEP_0175803308 /NCGR_PEP_ID=MMETSP0097-20121207/88477_1 /TAXON_ID=311494 /ORGANISM="Alexandrium monilatum, Strain CCMP3105" /LENGTH=84 /DNA_ID=CAMNT_0017114647 /DNA_START=436 /DNA_END=690 /DNA_ORIENTATION=+
MVLTKMVVAWCHSSCAAKMSPQCRKSRARTPGGSRTSFSPGSGAKQATSDALAGKDNSAVLGWSLRANAGRDEANGIVEDGDAG